MSDLEEEIQNRVEDLLDRYDSLIGDVDEFFRGLSIDNNIWMTDENAPNRLILLTDYETWYNSSLPLISDYMPDREDDFRERYWIVREAIEADRKFVSENNIELPQELRHYAIQGLHFQHDIIASIPGRVESEILKAKEQISRKIVTDELQKSKELFDEEHVRAAGVVAGVALERHLLSLCEDSNQVVDFGYMDGISSLAQTLSEAGEIDDDDQRLLDHLSGIRNKCSHASEQEPEKREVERLLNESDEFIRTLNTN